MNGNPTPSPELYISLLEMTNRLTEPAIRAAIKRLRKKPAPRILDVPCGIGSHTIWLAEELPDARVIGSDFSTEHLDYAEELSAHGNVGTRVSFTREDMLKLSYEDDSFDIVWSCDGIWPGPPETGCIVTEPYSVLEEFKRIVKPGGTVAVLFWTGHKLLAGHPYIETALNATAGGNLPMKRDTDPDLHMMRASYWLERTGLRDIKAESFTADISAPASGEEEQRFLRELHMLWGTGVEELDAETRSRFRNLIDPGSDEYIFGMPGYAGYVVYTMFSGIV
jgi:demethylmenaquinone methyltransferase/2-methoxy-6-polyprenyl-1,4-benzoquinol methylase